MVATIEPAAPPARDVSVAALARPSGEEIRRARRQLHAKAVGIAALALGTYTGLVFVATGLLVQLVCLVMLSVAITAIGTGIMHDANHGAFFRSRRGNRAVSFSADLVGASSWVWRFKHNTLHHGRPNHAGFDNDIDQAPFARLAPSQPWRPWHRYQHVYLWGLYGFLALKWFLVSDVAALVRGGFGTNRFSRPARRADVAAVATGKMVHLGWAVVIPLFRHPWWGVAAFYVAGSWIVGFTLAMVFQLAHCNDEVDFTDPESGPEEAFAVRQLRATANIRCAGSGPVVSGISRWLMGGLDHQIEHHLAPGLPHTVYPVMAARVQRLCLDRGLPYREHPSVWAAVRSHGRWLKALGHRPDRQP